MNNGKIFLLAVFGCLATGDALAQATAEANQTAEAERVRADRTEVNVEDEMRTAEAHLAEAARRVAELSSRRLPQVRGRRFSVGMIGRPVIGITIGGDSSGGPVEGARITGITPGGAAEEAGLRASDILTAIDKESMSASTSQEAANKVLDFMAGVRDGDTLDIEYMRKGKVATVEIAPRPGVGDRNLVWFSDGAGGMPVAPVAPLAPLASGPPGFSDFVFRTGAGGWGDMEMVTLTKDLGKYFGTDKGLLIVRAPSEKAFKLMDGDVLQSIDGREPTSVSHAVRILGSYQSGETLEIQIMRNKKRETLKVEVPDNRQGRLLPDHGPIVIEGGAPVHVVTRGKSD